MGKVFCQKCGSVLSESAAFCPACGSANEGGGAKASKPSSQSKMIWIIILSVLFVIALGVAIFILTDTSGFLRVNQKIEDMEYLDNYFASVNDIGKNVWVGSDDYNYLKSEQNQYYVILGICGIVGLMSLVGNILLFMKIKKKK